MLAASLNAFFALLRFEGPSAAARQIPPFVTCGDIFPRPGEVGPLGGASARPQRRAFAESGAANAVFRYDPSREKVNRENPQIFPIYKL